ncbi:hypothetical protein LI291_08600 [Intestinibacillus massiliensis]|nr:hypothetical protein [Intestinibacillus massiliensis]
MLTPLAAGALAFALFVLFDLCKAYTRARRPGLLFAAGGLLLAGAAARLFFPPAPGWTALRALSAAWAAAWLLLLVYVLFFALPAGDVYGAAAPPAVCDRGAYALCRHPGFWCFLFCALGLWLAAGTPRMGAGALVFSGLDLAYVAAQDRWLFPKYLAGYAGYQQSTPFLFPNRRSAARCFGRTL